MDAVTALLLRLLCLLFLHGGGQHGRECVTLVQARQALEEEKRSLRLSASPEIWNCEIAAVFIIFVHKNILSSVCERGQC